MARQRRSSKAAVTVGALILASITIITVNARGGTGAIGGVRGLVGEITSPVFSAVDAVVSPVGNLLAGTINYGRVQRENEQLRAALARLETQAALNSTAAQQLAQLMALEHLPYLGSLPLVTAQTIDVNRSNFEATITLNKGRSSGILVGMPVVSSAGLVGAVVAVSNATATVRLITDSSSSVSVELLRPNAPTTPASRRSSQPQHSRARNSAPLQDQNARRLARPRPPKANGALGW